MSNHDNGDAKKPAASRRSFLKTAMASGALFGATSLIGCAEDSKTVVTGGDTGVPATWDLEADVVVLGYGGAGAAAAIAAADAGSSVILLEKAPEGEEGGNTGVAGGGWINVTDRAKGIQFIKAQCGDTASDEEIAGFVDEVMGTNDWIRSIGGTVAPYSGTPMPGILYPGLPGADGVPGASNVGGPGSALFAVLRTAVEDREAKIKVMWQTPAKQLVFDPVTKEVFGVRATNSTGAEITIKAKKGVVMALGGYENHDEMKTNFFAPGVKIYPWGTPHNTGDGLPMAAAIGAKLRHFSSVEWGSYCSKPASEEAGTAVAMVYTSPQFSRAILVNAEGKRFVSENHRSAGFLPSPTHDKEPLPQLAYSLKSYTYSNGKFFMLFDEPRRTAGPIFNLASATSGQSWCGVHKNFTWSNDNQGEVTKGYLLKANTIAELATLAGIDPDQLTATVEAWNAACAAGTDTEFGRTEQLDPIDTGPFYLAELALSFINTQGGTDRNAKHEVLDWDGNVIPRLFAGGEFGSIYGFLYQGAGNIAEALGARVAGENAAKLAAWDAK